MTDDQMRISVVVPTFNRSKTLRNCIESLLKQTLDSTLYEIIIVDNNSKDTTRETVSEYLGPRRYNVRYVFEPQQGLQYARNTGAKAAHTPILAFTDDDAICDVRWLEELLRAYDDDEIGCAGGKIIVKWDENPPVWVLAFNNYFGQLDETRLGSTFRILKPGEYIFGGNCSIRKSVLFEVGGFNPDIIGDTPTVDSEIGLWNKVYKKGIKIAWVPAAMIWHIQPVSKNATLPEVKRRFRHWSVVSTSAWYKENPCSGLRLVASSLSSFSKGIRCKTNVLINSIRASSFDYHHELRSTFFLQQALFKLDLAFSRNKREAVLQENWLD